tara:strand:+ start:349 stop:510 length:162 start_codon:yes stop_codon:yes gene_type:complete
VISLPTNLALDDELIEEALVIGGHRTKKAVVTEALKVSILVLLLCGLCGEVFL